MNLIDNHLQNIFGLSSANFHKYPELWMKNIELFIPQIYQLISLNSNYKSNIIDIIEIENMNVKNSIDSKIIQSYFQKYGSDKYETYFPLYAFILNKFKEESIRLLEIGLGTNDPTLVSTMGIGTYSCGGSLRSFRDYLPKSMIYGADVDKNCLFNESNINTFFVDQLNINTFDELYTMCGNKKFDVIIDDGLHSIGANLNTIIFALQNINSNGVIIIEDILYTKIQAYQIIDYILHNNEKNKYKTTFITYKNKSVFLYIIELL
jgi:hypothetical protein